MPEACFLCLDSTEYMRNGDLFPTRLCAEQEAASMLVNAKTEINPENTIGFLTMGGKNCTVHETLTADVERVMASISGYSMSGTECHLVRGLQVASLALNHRSNARAEKRIVAFVGTPLADTDKELEALAKKLRKDDVAVDIIGFGESSNVPLLEEFIAKVNKQNNSRFLSVSSGTILDPLMASSIFMGEDATAAGGVANYGGGGGGGGFDFGMDPSMDPELAMALRMSLEDERQRQAAQQQASNNAAAPASSEATAASTATDANEAAPAPTPAAPANEAEQDDTENLTEDELLERALRLSMEEATQSDNKKEEKVEAAPTTTPTPAPAPAPQQQPSTTAGDDDNEVDDDEEFQRALLMSLEEGSKEKKEEDKDEKKE